MAPVPVPIRLWALGRYPGGLSERSDEQLATLFDLQKVNAAMLKQLRKNGERESAQIARLDSTVADVGTQVGRLSINFQEAAQND